VAIPSAWCGQSSNKPTVDIQPPDPNSCIADNGVPCYTPQQIREAYGLTPLLNAGYDGAGQTIVIIESFGSPTIESDLKVFDAAFNLPDPPSFRVLAPLGTVPFNPDDLDHLIWAWETSLDVQWAHAMAPGANIVLLTSPVDETQGVQGLPEFLELEKYALDHRLGHIISQSWGTTENTLFNPTGRKVIYDFERFYEKAAAEHVTILAGAGDSGSANVDVSNNFYPFPTVLFPASSPFVLAVGGTTLQASSTGFFESESVWNTNAGNASGGGISQYFTQPRYQRALPHHVQKQLGGFRGIPDVAIHADPVFFYAGFYSDAASNTFISTGGTSEATACWAGVIAVANQLAGRPLGFVNPKLYLLGALGEQAEFFRDVKTGNNAANGVPGYDATSGFDLASGWGTPNLGKLLWEIREDR